MRKNFALLAEDIQRYISGRPVVTWGDWNGDPWVYPTDWSAMLADADRLFGPFDGAGIPLQPANGEVYYTPSRIAGYALASWNQRASSARLRSFIACANWFAEVPEARFEYHIEVGGMRAPWLSCIGQGQAVSVLTRAFRHTSDSTYLDQAIRAVEPLTVAVEDGGLLSRLDGGGAFLEEYPGSYPHVLNGCLHALVGLTDLRRIGCDAGGDVLDAVVQSVSCNIDRWDWRGWSTYDLQPPGRAPNLTTLNYHMVHCILLRYLASVAACPSLGNAASRWETSAKSWRPRLRALGGKLRYRVMHGW